MSDESRVELELLEIEIDELKEYSGLQGIALEHERTLRLSCETALEGRDAEIAELKATIALSDDDKLDEACAFEEERTARKAYQAENAKLKAQAEIDKDFIKQYQSEHGITVPWPSKERSQ